MMSNKKTFRALPVCICFALIVAFADPLAEYDHRIEQNTRQLRDLEKQINELQSEIKKYEQQERNLVRELDNTERQISLASEKIRLQNRELQLRRARQAELQKDYNRAEKNSEILIRRYENRVVHAYKLRPARQWDLYFDATSPKEFYYRIKYITAVNQADRQLYKDIQDNLNLIDMRQAQIREESEAIRRNVAALEMEQGNLKKLKSDKERQYDRVKSDRGLLAQQIEEKERSVREIRGIIEKTQGDKKAYLDRLEEERRRREVVEVPFVQKKGRLPWPVTGKIVGEFGTQKHPVLGTITESSGIDIQTRSGSPVRAVSDGMVVTVTWLRGFGNTIIVIHDNSYYSVYSHVENILVIQDEYVDANQQLATVSSDGIMNAPILHFELWQEQEKLNPRHWLQK